MARVIKHTGLNLKISSDGASFFIVNISMFPHYIFSSIKKHSKIMRIRNFIKKYNIYIKTISAN